MSWLKGRPRDDETKRKISESMRGRTRGRSREARSPETRKAISEGQKRAWILRKLLGEQDQDAK